MRCAVAVLVAGLVLSADCRAGMPSLLPTSWTAENPRDLPVDESAVLARVQAISFFTAVFLACAWGFQRLWNSVGGDLNWLPRIGYRRALALVTLWAFLFVVVLTMISGARELMTPGAWRKQGWTYTLNSPAPPDPREEQRVRAMERLQTALWQYARDHEGRFPADRSPVDPGLWKLDGWDGLRIQYVPGLKPDDAGRILAYEPEVFDEPCVLLTNGAVVRMRTADLRRLLAEKPAGGRP